MREDPLGEKGGETLIEGEWEKMRISDPLFILLRSPGWTRKRK
jgi:hypothetical protein